MRIATILAATAATAALGFAATAQAQTNVVVDPGVYANIGASAVGFDSYNISGKLGYEINQFFAVEAQGEIGVIDDDFDVGGGEEIDIGVDFAIAGFAVGKFPVGQQFDVFGRVGYYYAEAAADQGDLSVSDDADGFAFGGGGQFWLEPERINAIRAEYTNLDLDSGSLISEDLWTLSYVRKF